MDPSLPCPGYFRVDVVELQVWAAVVRVLEQPEVIAAEVTSQQVNANEQR